MNYLGDALNKGAKAGESELAFFTGATDSGAIEHALLLASSILSHGSCVLARSWGSVVPPLRLSLIPRTVSYPWDPGVGRPEEDLRRHEEELGEVWPLASLCRVFKHEAASWR